ncbi:SecDF P1 head subdomain-containing protein [Actinoallomurus liliacearum]
MRFAVHRSARRPASPHGQAPEPGADAEDTTRPMPPVESPQAAGEPGPGTPPAAGAGPETPPAGRTGRSVGDAESTTRPMPPVRSPEPGTDAASGRTRLMPPAGSPITPMPPVGAGTTTSGGAEPSSTGRPEDRRSVMRIARRPERGVAAGPARRAGGRPGLIAAVVILWLVIAAIALTGTLIVAFSQEHPARFAAPLKIYPVAQAIPGQQCPPGVQGMMGQSGIGPVCYQLTTGITIKRVNDIHVERAKKSGGYAVSISLAPADGRALKRLTRNAAGRTFALTVRDQVVAAPRVDAPITKGRVLITGNLGQSAAQEIVNRLKTGKGAPVPTPAPVWTPPTQTPTPSPTLTTPSQTPTPNQTSTSPSPTQTGTTTPTPGATTTSSNPLSV